MATITSANAQLAISVPGVFSAPQLIQGFSVDDAFTSEAVEQAETQMGVDGEFTAGKIWMPYPMTIRLLASSPAIRIFDTWRQQQDSDVDVFAADGSIVLSAIGMTYTLVNGYLKKATPFPGAKKILEQVEYEIEWQRIVAGPTAAY